MSLPVVDWAGETGSAENIPLFCCVPGLMGGPDDFKPIFERWKNDLHFVCFDVNGHTRVNAFTKSEESLAQTRYDQNAKEIKEYLDTHHPGRKTLFMGTSLGGKIVFDFADKFPDVFGGAVVSDIGPGVFQDSDVYKLFTDVVPSIDLHLPWEAMRQELRAKIPDPLLRVMLQTQLSYPEKKGTGPAQWKNSLDGLQRMLDGLRMRDQWSVAEKLRAPVVLLKAANLSGISDADFVRLQNHSSFHVLAVPDSNHFLHRTRQKEVDEAIKLLLQLTRK